MSSIVRFPLSVTDRAGITVCTFPAEVDVCNAYVIREQLLRLLDRGAGPLVIDLSATRFCDCTGVGAIVRAGRRARALGVRVCLVLPTRGTVHRLAAVTGLSRRFPIATRLDAACAALREPVHEPAPGS
jgi:anti-sigma B factor antagonist